jgi:hypothetical protein
LETRRATARSFTPTAYRWLRADRPGTAVVELALVRLWQLDAPADSLVVRLDA